MLNTVGNICGKNYYVKSLHFKAQRVTQNNAYDLIYRTYIKQYITVLNHFLHFCYLTALFIKGNSLWIPSTQRGIFYSNQVAAAVSKNHTSCP